MTTAVVITATTLQHCVGKTRKLPGTLAASRRATRATGSSFPQIGLPSKRRSTVPSSKKPSSGQETRSFSWQAPAWSKQAGQGPR